MRYAANFFRKSQLSKIFICFPDPHFKQKNHRRRIVSAALLDEYAFFLKPGGLLYTVTDVEELGQWHDEKCSAHLLFEKVSLISHHLCICVSVSSFVGSPHPTPPHLLTVSWIVSLRCQRTNWQVIRQSRLCSNTRRKARRSPRWGTLFATLLVRLRCASNSTHASPPLPPLPSQSIEFYFAKLC